MTARVKNINPAVLRQCREQMGYCLLDVKKKIKMIEDMESGKHKPTFNHLDTLSELYQVPRWVFCADALPLQYRFEESSPAFRQFVGSEAAAFKSPKVRCLTTKVSQLRSLIMELWDDINGPILRFSPPMIDGSAATAATAAQRVRQWLGSEKSLPFEQWKQRLEDKGIFVFMTSKYPGWSRIDQEVFRGMAISTRFIAHHNYKQLGQPKGSIIHFVS